MLKMLIAFKESSDWEGTYHQELWDPDKRTCLFSVSNLWECPEDAIIGRALHDSDDARFLIEYGMELVKEGYDSIEVKYEECPKNEDIEDFIDNYLDKWKPVQKD